MNFALTQHDSDWVPKRTFFTSDTHFFHKNIIKYCDRPFKDVGDMTEGLIERWNSVVSPDDQVFHLGDVAFGGWTKQFNVINRLHGYKHVVLGNHDLPGDAMRKAGFECLTDTHIWADEATKAFYWMNHIPTDNSLDSRGFVRPHCPLKIVNTAKVLGWQIIPLCGHVHSAWKSRNGCINVGVDVWDYKPISLEEVHAYWKEITQ